MKTLEIPVKFQNGDLVYITKQTKVEMICHICEGTGKIKYNEKDMKCPECMGVGTFKSNKQIYIVCDNPYTITSTKININDNGTISVKYKIKDGFLSLNRAEENVFSNREDAEKRCEELNREKIYMHIDDIIIKEDFKETIPSINKIKTKLDYYVINNNFDRNIVINKENVLQDGYINYLLCKLLKINIVKVIIEEVV